MNKTCYELNIRTAVLYIVQSGFTDCRYFSIHIYFVNIKCTVCIQCSLTLHE